MKSITLENFKLFGKPTQFDLSPVTILTGKNSSGKSSFIKALLFLDDFHSKGMMIVNEFNGPLTDKHKIRSFNELKSWNREDELVTLKYKTDTHFIRYSFTNCNGNAGYSLNSFTCHLNTKGFKGFEGKYGTGVGPHVVVGIDDEAYSIIVDPIFLIIHSSGESFSKLQDLNSLQEIMDSKRSVNAESPELEDYEKQKKEILNYFDKLFTIVENTEHINIERPWIGDLGSSFNCSISDLLTLEFDRYLNSKRNGQTLDLSDFHFRPARKIDYGNFKIDYTGPDRVGTNRVFVLNDNTFQMSDVLNRYRIQIQSLVERPTGHSNFLEEWPKQFGIGDRIKINYFEDQVATVKVLKGDQEFDLSDLGFGVSQIAFYLIKLQVIYNDIFERDWMMGVNDKPFGFRYDSSDILIIEEPETNLHPDLQSKLADLFFEVSLHHNWPLMIIETHSEYLIRRTQVLVKEIGLQNNPFKVYYFDKEKGPYEMRYREDGKFIDSFGSGFLDESRRHTFDLL